MTNVLVRYRVTNGGALATIDQRLIVFVSGDVQLDERHRSRENTALALTAQELEQLRFLLQRVPERRWSYGPTLSRSRINTALKYLSLTREDQGTTHFQLKRGRRSIAGEVGGTDLDVVVMLDELRIRAVRLAETLNPTVGG